MFRAIHPPMILSFHPPMILGVHPPMILFLGDSWFTPSKPPMILLKENRKPYINVALFVFAWQKQLRYAIRPNQTWFEAIQLSLNDAIPSLWRVCAQTSGLVLGF